MTAERFCAIITYLGLVCFGTWVLEWAFLPMLALGVNLFLSVVFSSMLMVSVAKLLAPRRR